MASQLEDLNENQESTFSELILMPNWKPKWYLKFLLNNSAFLSGVWMGKDATFTLKHLKRDHVWDLALIRSTTGKD